MPGNHRCIWPSDQSLVQYVNSVTAFIRSEFYNLFMFTDQAAIMKPLVLLISIVFTLMVTGPAIAADSDARLDRMEQQISLFSTQLEMMRADIESSNSRLDAVDDMEITLLRMEQNLRQMRSQLKKAQYTTHHVSSQTRPMIVHATW